MLANEIRKLSSSKNIFFHETRSKTDGDTLNEWMGEF